MFKYILQKCMYLYCIYNIKKSICVFKKLLDLFCHPFLFSIKKIKKENQLENYKKGE